MGGSCPYTQQSMVIGAVKPFAGRRGEELSDTDMQTLTSAVETGGFVAPAGEQPQP
jgi:hypothetical protein